MEPHSLRFLHSFGITETEVIEVASLQDVWMMPSLRVWLNHWCNIGINCFLKDIYYSPRIPSGPRDFHNFREEIALLMPLACISFVNFWFCNFPQRAGLFGCVDGFMGSHKTMLMPSVFPLAHVYRFSGKVPNLTDCLFWLMFSSLQRIYIL